MYIYIIHMYLSYVDNQSCHFMREHFSPLHLLLLLLLLILLLLLSVFNHFFSLFPSLFFFFSPFSLFSPFFPFFFFFLPFHFTRYDDCAVGRLTRVISGRISIQSRGIIATIEFRSTDFIPRLFLL